MKYREDEPVDEHQYFQTTPEDFYEEFPFGLAVVKDNLLYHLVGYPKHPSQIDVALVEELRTDGDLELTDLREYEIFDVSGDDFLHYLKQFMPTFH